AVLALDGDVAAHHLAELAADREPQPRAPYFSSAEASAWLTASNSRPICSGVMPMPVSETANVSHSAPSIDSRRATSRIVPCSVNLQALLSRLNSAWRTLVRSACMAPRSSGQ